MWSRSAADHEIRTTIPLAGVAAKVLHLASVSPDGDNMAEPRFGRAQVVTGKN